MIILSVKKGKGLKILILILKLTYSLAVLNSRIILTIDKKWYSLVPNIFLNHKTKSHFHKSRVCRSLFSLFCIVPWRCVLGWIFISIISCEKNIAGNHVVMEKFELLFHKLQFLQEELILSIYIFFVFHWSVGTFSCHFFGIILCSFDVNCCWDIPM